MYLTLNRWSASRQRIYMTIPSDTQDNQAQAPELKSSNDKEYNFSQIRKQLEQERQARQQAEERAARAEQERDRRSSQSLEDDEISDEPYVDHRALERKLKKFESTMDERIERKADEKARSYIEQERRNGYLKQNADFNQVMQPEIMQKFVDRHPGLAEGILAMPDSFERQKLVYENIKALGLHNKEEPKKSIQDTIDQNRRSPFYQPSGVGTSPYSTAGDFSPAGQKNAYAKLQELKNKLRI